MKNGGVIELPIDDVRQVVQVANVVALVLEAAPVLLPEHREYLRDVAKRVLEDEVFGRTEVWFLPVVFPGLVPVGEREEPEIHAAHVERAHLRAEEAGAFKRSSTVMLRPPPVVTLMIAPLPSLSRGRNAM